MRVDDVLPPRLTKFPEARLGCCHAARFTTPLWQRWRIGLFCFDHAGLDIVASLVPPVGGVLCDGAGECSVEFETHEVW